MHKIPSTNKMRGFRSLIGITLLGTAVPVAMALTPSGTEIRNQSTATYTDPAGKPQIATSNEVINTVAPVYSVVVTPNATGSSGFFQYDGTAALSQSTAAGNVAYFSYILENMRNAPDTYTLSPNFQPAAAAVIAPATTGVEVYYDANGNGFVDAGDTLLATRSAAGALTNSAATPIVNPNKKIGLVVAVHTPAAATTAQEINTDFNVTGVANGATDATSNWNTTTFLSAKGILTAYKSANVSSAKAGDTLTYTIQGSNTGSAFAFSKVYTTEIDTDGDSTDGEAVEGILISDVLDQSKLAVGTNYADVTISTAAGTISPSISVPVYWDSVNSRWTTTKAEATPGVVADSVKVGIFIPDTDSIDGAGDGASAAVLAPGQSYRFTFTVPITAGLAATEIENDVTSEYRSDSTTDASTTSNLNLVTVGGDAGSLVIDVELSPYTFSDGATASNTAITNGTTRGSQQHPLVDATGVIATNDTTTAGSSTAATDHRNAGTTVVFPITLTNPSATSSVTDIFNITYSTPDSGYTVILYKADGITPLADTNADGLPDVGQVAPGAFADLVVKMTIADNLVDADGTTVTVTATSVQKNASSGTTTSDTTTLVVTEVRPAGVDIATTGQIGGDDATQTNGTATADDDDDATATAVSPGSTFTIPFEIANMRNATQNTSAVDETTSAVDTYTLTVTPVTAGTADFAYVFFKDANGNQTLDAAELDPITDSGSLDPVTVLNSTDAEVYDGLLRITLPDSTVAGDYFVDVTATSTNKSSQTDTMRVKITVLSVPDISITPDNTATVVRGGTVTFKHVVTNTGNEDDDVVITVGALPSGYSAVLIDCTTGSVLGTGSSYSFSDLDPAESFEVCVRVFVPANAAIGSTVPATITATLGAALPTDDAVDIVTVIDGNLDLQKVNAPTTAVAPGGTIAYTTTYRQLGAANINNVLIFDAIPANTKLVVAGANIPTATLPSGTTVTTAADAAYFEYSTNGGLSWISWSATPPTADGDNADASVTNLRLDLGGTADVATATATMNPGQSGTFTFTVIVE